MKEKNKRILIFIIIIGGLLLYSSSLAHPGNTASDGCHYCRTNCSSWGVAWNQRHCHRAKALPQPEPPIKSHRDGSTEPAPEYEAPPPTVPPVQPPAQQYKTLTPQYKSPAPNSYTAEIPKENNEDFSWGWIIGLGVVGFIWYIFNKKKN